MDRSNKYLNKWLRGHAKPTNSQNGYTSSRKCCGNGRVETQKPTYQKVINCFKNLPVTRPHENSKLAIVKMNKFKQNIVKQMPVWKRRTHHPKMDVFRLKKALSPKPLGNAKLTMSKMDTIRQEPVKQTTARKIKTHQPQNGWIPQKNC